jgi:hypothetical protein
MRLAYLVLSEALEEVAQLPEVGDGHKRCRRKGRRLRSRRRRLLIELQDEFCSSGASRVDHVVDVMLFPSKSCINRATST